jgi:uncharacterized protein (DUF697 family)
MNQPLLLHVVERLETLIGKLPAAIQNPILSELTPLKELFLQQRTPRLLFVGPGEISVLAPELETASGAHVWTDVRLGDRGTMSILDARSADPRQIVEEIKRQPADAILFVDEEGGRGPRKIDIDQLRKCIEWNEESGGSIRVIAITSAERAAKLQEEDIKLVNFEPPAGATEQAEALISFLARELPNEARIEMIRIAGDKQGQHDVAQVLIKSTTAICTAIGAQPIPLADMPILTTLQLVMVSGIMYVSGRERTLRAATEFIGALGVNVGAGMVLREGARAILKFVPGWGNLVSGAVAGAGTYAIGRAAEAFFIEGVSIKDARRTYLKSRKKSPQQALPAPKTDKAGHKRRRK